MPVIETHELRKEYGDVVAVDSLTLSVEQGEVFGFLGPNGAGKTTTVKALLGLVHLTSGQARILGREPGDPAVMAQVGFLPEHFHFHPWLKAADFLDLHGRLYHMPRATRQARIRELLERVGLADRAGVRLAQFSKGMSQRVGLAQALLNEPTVVFLDEPTSGLDPLGRRRVRDIIRDLRNQGVTVFLNSHLLGEVELTCDRVAIIQRGRVARAGTIEALTGTSLEVEIRATGMTTELQTGLEQWGQVSWVDGNRLAMRVPGDDVLPAIADWLVAGGAQLYALSPRRLSLEELFVRILESETGRAAIWGEE